MICLPDNSWFLWRSSVVFVCESCKNTYGSKFSINTAVKFVMSNKKPLSTPCYFLSWLLIIRLEKRDLENWVKNVLPWDWIFIVKKMLCWRICFNFMYAVLLMDFSWHKIIYKRNLSLSTDRLAVKMVEWDCLKSLLMVWITANLWINKMVKGLFRIKT